MNNVMGIINDIQKESILKDLTEPRSLASVPFGCRYRLIDFPLSNMSNSGIINVGILVENKFRSLLDHLGPGKAWDLDRKREGLFILPPAQIYSQNRIYRGDVESLYCNLDYLHRSRQEYVILANSDIICNMIYDKPLNFHRQSGADITIIYQKKSAPVQEYNHTSLSIDTDNKVQDIKVSPTRKKYKNISLNKFIMKKELLIDLIDDCYSKGRWDFIKDGIINNLDHLDIRGFPFSGFVAQVNSIKSYFKANINLLQPEVRDDILLKNQIYTKPKDEAPTKFTKYSKTKNIIAANGCIIEGDVENSIIFRGVIIKKGAQIKNCVILQKSKIGRKAKLENVIMDKNSRIRQEQKLIGSNQMPIIVGKNEKV